MRRSTGFGSNPCNLPPYSDSVSLRLHLIRLNLAAKTVSPTHYAKGTLLYIQYCYCVVLHPLVNTRFQFLFHSPHRGSFHLSLTVLCAIGRQGVLALDDGPPCFTPGSSCPALLGYRSHPSTISTTGLSPSLVPFPIASSIVY